jgi:hypothetical protein
MTLRQAGHTDAGQGDPQRPVLEFSREAWAAFLTDLPTVT